MQLIEHVGDSERGLMRFSDGQIVCWWNEADTVVATPVPGSSVPHVRWLDHDDESDPFAEVIADPSTPPTRPMTAEERAHFDSIVRLAETAD